MLIAPKQERSAAKAGWPGGAKKVRPPNRLRPYLRTGYAEEDETSQDPGHCLSRFPASLPRVLLMRGFGLFGVTRS